MGGALEFVIFTVLVVAVAVALATLRSRTRAYDEIGDGGLQLDRDAEPAGNGDAALEAEVRALVIAANERRERRGEPALDVEAEVSRRLEARS